MKRVIIGGFLSFIGSIWGVAILILVGNNLVSSWYTPPGRFLTTLSKTDMTVPLVIASIVVLLGLVIMGIEYFKKDN